MNIAPIKIMNDNGGIVPPWLIPGNPADPDTPRILPMPPSSTKKENSK